MTGEFKPNPRAQERHRQEGPGYDAGSTLWYSSEQCGGPDVGIQVGLGRGFSLYAGELPKVVLEDHRIDPSYPDGWWLVLYGPADEWIIGAVPEPYRAQEALEQLAALCPAHAPQPTPSDGPSGGEGQRR